MNTLAYDQREEGWEAGQAPEDDRLPQRPRRRYLNKTSLALTALVTCAAGFYAGVRVEKSQTTSSSAASSASSLFSRLRAGSSGSPAAGGASAAAGSSASGRSAAGGGGLGAFRGGFGGGAGGGPSFGTIASVSGSTIYVTESSGNTVKIQLSSATKITKNLSVGRSALHPGDTVVVSGVKNHSGAIVPATVSDSGNRSSGTGSSGSSGSGSSSSSGGGGVSSLFSPGG
jgi:hypothetical protein